MRRLLIGLLWATMLFVLPASHAQTPANEHNCPATTAIPPYVGSGTKAHSLCRGLARREARRGHFHVYGPQDLHQPGGFPRRNQWH